MVIEAVPERLELKRAIFGELDGLADPEVILAKNSSSLPTSQFIFNRISAAIKRECLNV